MAKNTWSLQGRTVLITGAARGIGAEAARRLSARGAQVSLAGLEPEELERVAADCGPGAAWFECDVTDPESLEAAVQGTVERFGGIDCVIANAGIASAGTVRLVDPEAFERVIAVNLVGVWRTVRACLPHVIERQGYVLVIASVAAAIHGPGMASYNSAKAGAEAFGNSLRQEVRHLGVGVGVGYFSWIATDMVAGADAHPAGANVRSKLPGVLGKTYPVSQAGEAVAAGVAGRRGRVMVPGWIAGLLAARDLIARLPLPKNEVIEAEQRFQADVDARGAEASSAPVGAGGAAAGRTKTPAG
jgi:NAD(P)-dependent dehydrogenase (short-subunit alcohol dehydrogenase family)